MENLKRENGFLVIDDALEILGSGGGLSSNWYCIQGKKCLFKTGFSLFPLYMELFGEEVAKALEIETVHYDLAVRNHLCGVISPTYNPDNLREIPLEDILNKYYVEVICEYPEDYPNELFLENTQNLEDVWWALDYYYKDLDNKDEVVKSIMEKIVDSFILQVALGNSDMHYQNLVLLEDKKPFLAPNFDYGQAGFVDFQEDENNYVLQVLPLSFKEDNSPQKMIRSFLAVSDEDTKDYFLNKIKKMPEAEEILAKIEMRIGVPLLDEVKTYLMNPYHTYKQTILEIAEQFETTKVR